MEITNAELIDLPAILEIMNHAILYSTSVYDYSPRSAESVAKWFARKNEDNFPVLVMKEEGRVLGYATYGIFRPWDGFKFSAEHSIYVADGNQGKGIGSALLAGLIIRARDQGFHTLIAGIDASNEGSVHFHKKLGFVETGRLREVGFKFDRWLDLVFMQLIL